MVSHKKKKTDDLVWFGLFLWLINDCRFFNTKFILYIYKQSYFKQFSLA